MSRRPSARPAGSPAEPPPGAEALRAAREALAADLRRRGLKRSRRRDTVVDVFLRATGHLSVDELTARVRARDPEIGQTTVYRTMKLLAECGLASPQQFGDRQTRYEPRRPGGHHDHLVCDVCGAIEEFEDEEVEALQRAVARRHGFALEGHRFELHGRCARCRAGAVRARPAAGEPPVSDGGAGSSRPRR